jgi:hypothetical protein
LRIFTKNFCQKNWNDTKKMPAPGPTCARFCVGTYAGLEGLLHESPEGLISATAVLWSEVVRRVSLLQPLGADEPLHG